MLEAKKESFFWEGVQWFACFRFWFWGEALSRKLTKLAGNEICRKLPNGKTSQWNFGVFDMSCGIEK